MRVCEGASVTTGHLADVTIRMPLPGPPVSVNELPTTVKGRIAFSRAKATWRDTTYLLARGSRAVRAGLPACTVQVRLPFPVQRRRDPHNYTSTCVKWIVDGLVKAGAWPDDTPEYVTVLDPKLLVTTDPTVTVILTPRRAA